MNKFIAFAMALVLLVSCAAFVSCEPKDVEEDTTVEEVTVVEPTDTTEEVTVVEPTDTADETVSDTVAETETVADAE